MKYGNQVNACHKHESEDFDYLELIQYKNYNLQLAMMIIHNF